MNDQTTNVQQVDFSKLAHNKISTKPVYCIFLTKDHFISKSEIKGIDVFLTLEKPEVISENSLETKGYYYRIENDRNIDKQNLIETIYNFDKEKLVQVIIPSTQYTRIQNLIYRTK